jgi:hypothetical protein
MAWTRTRLRARFMSASADAMNAADPTKSVYFAKNFSGGLQLRPARLPSAPRRS